MEDGDIPQGCERFIDGRPRVYYDGYWIRSYPVPSDSLLEKRRLIAVLTRRLFNHVEHGLNIPSSRLDEARRAYEKELDPQRKRVKGGMLAGALFNRAAEVLTALVELQAAGDNQSPDPHLMQLCGSHLCEALELGKLVLHRSGEEGIDELWGEPFKAFAFPIEEFYKSRYVKVAMTMRAIDALAAEMCVTFGDLPAFRGIRSLVLELAPAAKVLSETLRTDADIFDVWASFAVALERLRAFALVRSAVISEKAWFDAESGLHLMREGVDLIDSIARVRVPMPKSTAQYIARCRSYAQLCASCPPPRRSMPSARAEPRSPGRRPP